MCSSSDFKRTRNHVPSNPRDEVDADHTEPTSSPFNLAANRPLQRHAQHKVHHARVRPEREEHSPPLVWVFNNVSWVVLVKFWGVPPGLNLEDVAGGRVLIPVDGAGTFGTR